MFSPAALLATYFDEDTDPHKLPPYITLGAKCLDRSAVALDSSDQSVLTFDSITGVAAYRSGLVQVSPDNVVIRRSIGEVRTVVVHPRAPDEPRLRLKLAREQLQRLRTGYRPYYSSLKNPPALIPSRLVAAGERVIEDYRSVNLFLNSIYASETGLFMLDGRLNAQAFPGPQAIDDLFRLMTMRGIRGVGVAKSGLLIDVVRPLARTIRRQVGERPFCFPVLKEYLLEAYRGQQITRSPKTIRHGSSSQALGGVGAIRFILSICADHLCLVEFNLYDLQSFRPLVCTGTRLEEWGKKTLAPPRRVLYSWDLLPFVIDRDWEDLFIPTLEELVYCSYTDTETGLCPRALADVHNRVKLRFRDLEMERRRWIVELVRLGIPPEGIPTEPEDPHKTDPDVVNILTL